MLKKKIISSSYVESSDAFLLRNRFKKLFILEFDDFLEDVEEFVVDDTFEISLELSINK